MKLIKISGKIIERFVISNRIHRLEKLVSLTPNKYVINPPNCPLNIDPKLIVDIKNAYMVPYIFFGQMRHASTRSGKVLSSPITWIKTLSPSVKTLSGTPN